MNSIDKIKGVLVIGVLLMGINCYSQSINAYGTVRINNSEEIIDSATVIVYLDDIEYNKIATDKNGDFILTFGKEGVYKLQFEKDFFSTLIYEDFQISTGDSISLGVIYLDPPAFECIEEVEVIE